jgi:hypothetical protein
VLLRQETQMGRLENTFWGNHPRLQDRIRYVSAEAKVKDCAWDSLHVAPDYAPIKWPMLKLSATLWVAERGPILAARMAQAYLAQFPGDADVRTTLGDAYALAAERDTTVKGAASRAAVRDTTPRPGVRDTLDLAIAAYRKALDVGGPEFRPPWRGLARVAERDRDTTACIGYLERYLAGDAQVKDRRMLRTKLEQLRASVAVTAPTPAAATAAPAVADSLKTPGVPDSTGTAPAVKQP